MADYVVDALIRVPLGVLASWLPRRWWPRLSGVVLLNAGTAFTSAMLSVVTALVIIFLSYHQRVSDGAGWLALYLLATGVARIWYAMFDEPVGDPLLTAVDSLVVQQQGRLRDGRARRERLAREGAEVPDVLLAGSTAGFPEARWVVISSRRKAGWTAGTFVRSGEDWFKLHAPVERMLPTGLRTFYPMSAAAELEVIRRWVDYELPTPVASRTVSPRQ
jgi:hypothetical protein